MKLEFDDKGYNFIEFKEAKDSGKIAVVLSSKDGSNPNKTIVNSAEITKEQFIELISGLDLSSGLL
ncbi:hypothetical protein LCGC14_0427170 [marine sediment metagenome]|uniref:Uncharacterized protein n=1 Tax=marine sediment metagenome TaxID=412755 RepID=A0A0F9SP84_9ZZZZ